MRWYSRRVYKINDEAEYDPRNRLSAFERAQEWDKGVPLGIIYRKERRTSDVQEPAIREVSVVKQRIDQNSFEGILDRFK